jgi:hypothetical protein
VKRSSSSTGLPAHSLSDHVTTQRLLASLWRRLILGNERLHIPDALRILVNTPVTREEAHPRHGGDGLCSPFLRVLVALIDELLRLDVRREVIRDKVVVAVVNDTVEQSRKPLGISECSLVDAVEHFGELRVELVVRVEMCVSEVLNVLSEVTEEEDVLLANLASNLDLSCC